MFTVYKRTTPDEKIYIGCTSMDVEKRAAKGKGYKNNKRFYEAIQKFGWANVKTEIIKVFDNAEEAAELEQELISKYNSTNPEFGFNLSRKKYPRSPHNKNEPADPVIRKIRQLIREKGIKQKFVADHIGFTEQEFSNMMNGRRMLKVDDIKPICKALGVRSGELFEEDLQ